MPDLALEARPPLGGFHANVDGTELTEVTGLAIVSIAIPLGGKAALEAALSEAYGIALPAPGRSVLSTDGKTRFLWTTPDQLFALFEDTSPFAAADVVGKLDGKAYVTLQSDSWVALRLRGHLARAAMERLCPLDLQPSAFGEGHVARTAMEHMGAFILNEAADAFLLLSASSSARSYLHAVQTSLQNVS